MVEVIEVTPFVSRHVCNQCGDCCESIPLNTTKKHLKELLDDSQAHSMNHQDAAFILKHWKRVSGRTITTQRFACDMFDQVSRLCTAHDDRPPICSRYPWYGTPPSISGDRTLHKNCSFWLDIPKLQRPEWAQPVTLRQRRRSTA